MSELNLTVQAETKEAFEAAVPMVVARAQAVVVKDDVQLIEADTYVGQIREAEKRAAGIFDPIVEAAHKAHKAATTARNGVLDPLKQARLTITSKMVSYSEARAREAEAAQRAIRERAEREAQERKLAEAVELEAQGLPEAAEIVMEAPAVVTVSKAEIAATNAPKLANTSFRENWTFELVDPTLKSISLDFLTLDEAKVRQVVKALKGDAQAILGPGIRVYREGGAAGKGGR